MTRTAIVDHPLDPTALLAEVATVASGASLLFVGTVREQNQGRPVTGIEYSAYRPMAERELQDIADEASRQFGVSHLVVEHRLGTLTLGEASIVIALSHARREPAMGAQRYVIEEVKTRVPIWKCEQYLSGERHWVNQDESPIEQGAS